MGPPFLELNPPVVIRGRAGSGTCYLSGIRPNSCDRTQLRSQPRHARVPSRSFGSPARPAPQTKYLAAQNRGWENSMDMQHRLPLAASDRFPTPGLTSAVSGGVPYCDPLEKPLSGVTSLIAIFSISTERYDSAEVNSFAACCAVLRFEPETAMPPSNAATAPAIMAGSNPITPKSIPTRTRLPPATDIREARMNLRQLSILAASSSIRSSRRTISSRGSVLWSSKVNAPKDQHAA